MHNGRACADIGWRHCQRARCCVQDADRAAQVASYNQLLADLLMQYVVVLSTASPS